MASQKQLEILRLGPEVWNRWYAAYKTALADFQSANLSCAELNGVILTGANLQKADFRYSVLRGADLRGANLQDAQLARADLSGARLDSAVGLTQSQINLAAGDESTQLPDYLMRPLHWHSCPQPELAVNSKIHRPLSASALAH